MVYVKDDTTGTIEKRILEPALNLISVGISWVDGRLLIKPDKKWAKAWYGICHYSRLVCMIFPLDMENCINIKTIHVSPSEDYCEKAHSCLNFDCVSHMTGMKINKFNEFVFTHEFKDIGKFSLGLPKNIGEETLWFNDLKAEHNNFARGWWRLVGPYAPDGVVLSYNEYMDVSIGQT